MLTTLIFDLDDTLIDEQGANRKASLDFYMANEELRHLYDEAEFLNKWREADSHFHRFSSGELTYEQLKQVRMSVLFDREFSQQEASATIATYLQFYSQHWAAYEGVAEILSPLAEQFNLVVFSNSTLFQIQEKLLKTQLSSYFSQVFSPEVLGAGKPSVEAYSTLLKQLNVDASECVMIGDSLKNDISAAKQVNITTIWLTHRSQEKSHIDADYAVETINGLPQVLDQLI